MWPRTAGGEPERKHSSVKAFKPWGWAYGAGVHLTEVEEAFSAGLAMTSMVAFAVLLAMALVSLLVVRSVLRQLGGEPADAVAAMRELAQGNLRRDRQQGWRGQPAGHACDYACAVAKHDDRGGTQCRGAEGERQRARRRGARVAERAQNQSDATSAIAAGVEEMTVSINHISDSARDTATNSSAAAALAEKGEEKTAEAADEMTRIAQTVGSALAKNPGARRQGQGDRVDRKCDQGDCCPDQPAGAQCRHRGCARRRAGPRLCGGRRRGSRSGRAYGRGDGADRDMIKGIQKDTNWCGRCHELGLGPG